MKAITLGPDLMSTVRDLKSLKAEGAIAEKLQEHIQNLQTSDSVKDVLGRVFERRGKAEVSADFWGY